MQDGDNRSSAANEREAQSDKASAGPETRAPLVDAATFREIVKIQPFTRWTGLEVLRVEYGFVETRMALRTGDMVQHHGFLHGGLIAFMADNVSAYAAATTIGDVLTAQFSVNYLSPGVGEAFVARGHVVKAGKRQVVTRADIFAVQGAGEKLVAVASAVILPAGAAALTRLPASSAA
ncbi:MAG: Phenylacetic acid degradation protein paaI [Oceanicaulis sp. HLUCCA04]|nr:MAG: Phenylacetic acid degradation protein paaI [Oceanicaulis sp. HLUCCA04]